MISNNEEETPLLLTKTEKIVSTRQLPLWKFVFLSYFCVCGGPYGLEEAIGDGYPGLTLLFIVVLPWIYSLPLALASAEMGSAMPDNDGFVLWVKTAFGPFWGYVSVVMDAFNYIADNAVYPVLFMSYLESVLEGFDFIQNPYYYYGIQFSVFFVVFLLNLAGVDLVGNASTLFAILILSPFLIMFLWSAAERKIDFNDMLELPPIVDARTVTSCFNIVMWGYCGICFIECIYI